MFVRCLQKYSRFVVFVCGFPWCDSTVIYSFYSFWAFGCMKLAADTDSAGINILTLRLQQMLVCISVGFSRVPTDGTDWRRGIKAGLEFCKPLVAYFVDQTGCHLVLCMFLLKKTPYLICTVGRLTSDSTAIRLNGQRHYNSSLNEAYWQDVFSPKTCHSLHVLCNTTEQLALCLVAI